jgi:hypothetical protein
MPPVGLDNLELWAQDFLVGREPVTAADAHAPPPRRVTIARYATVKHLVFHM